VIQNNLVRESTTGGSGLGGAIFAGTHTSFAVSNSQILNNQAVQATGQGGGIYIFGPSGGRTDAIPRGHDLASIAASPAVAPIARSHRWAPGCWNRRSSSR